MASWTITEAHLQHARAVVSAHLWNTPCVAAPALDHAFLKLENLQRTSSFKVRGALAKMSSLDAEEVIAASAGNHGLGVAYAAKQLGKTARIFVPKTAAEIKVKKMRALDAEVNVTDAAGYDDAEALAIQVAKEEGVAFVSPYDDPMIAAGNGGTTGAEIFARAAVSAVVLPVGGGGLLAGVIASRGDRSVPIIGVQASASPGMVRSLQAGHAIERFDGVPTLAEGLEGGVAPSTYDYACRDGVTLACVSEDAIADAMRFAYQTLGQRVEGSAAVAIAYVRAHREALGASPTILVTGGNVDDSVLERVGIGAL